MFLLYIFKQYLNEKNICGMIHFISLIFFLFKIMILKRPRGYMWTEFIPTNNISLWQC